MNINEAVGVLAKYEAFAVYVAYVKNMREQTIADMHGVTTDNLQQISGRILSLNDILALSNAEQVLRQHRD